MKKFCKRTLAVILSLLMVFASGGAALAALIEDVPEGSVKFYVPECIYLYPGDAESTTRWCQYFLNNTDGSGNYSYARGAETSGKFYFYCENATNISVTASGNSLTLGNFATTATGTTLNNSAFTLTAKNTNSIIEWKVDYTCKDGATRTAYAYTYIYRPQTVPTGTGFEASGVGNSGSCYVGGVQLLWGANSTQTGGYGVNSAFNIDGSGLYSRDNQQPINCDMINSNWTPKHFNYTYTYGIKGQKVEGNAYSPTAYYYIDGSRFTNTNQLPHFRLGLTMSDDEKTEYTSVRLYLKNSSGGVITTYISTDKYVDTEWVIANYTGGGKYGKVVSPNIAATGISSSGTTYYFQSWFYGCGLKGYGDAYTNVYSHFTVYNNNKYELRNYYFDCINASYTMQQERYTADSWTTYMTALRSAGTTLGDPAASAAAVATAKTNLESARNALQVETHTAKARHVALNHTGSNTLSVADLVTDAATEETLTYTGGSTLTAKNNAYTGYTLVGYKADMDDGSGTSYTADLTGITKTSDAVIKNYRSDGDKLYTFYYTPNLYTVTLDDNGATAAGTDKVYVSYGDAFYKDAAYAQKMTDAANGISVPSRTGYIFEGFYSGDTQMISSAGFLTENASTTAYTADTTWTAKWTPITYTVRYNGNGATSGDITASEHTYDEPKALTENGFARTGFNFAGWSYSANDAVNFANGASVTNLTDIANKTIDLFAIWNINTYTVAYEGNGATSGSTDLTVCTYNTDAAAAESGFERTGYTFAGWSTAPEGKVIYNAGDAMRNLTDENNGTVTLYAVWTPIKYKITFNNYDGTKITTILWDYDSVPVYTGSTPTKPKEGSDEYVFDYWSPVLTKVTGEAEYTAVFRVLGKPCLVRFFLDDYNVYAEQTVPQYEEATAPETNPTKASTAQYDYEFVGWTPEVGTIYGTTRYDAVFKATLRKYTVNFLSEDGTTGLETQQVEYGATPVFGGAAPTKESTAQYDYVFSGWDTPLAKVTGDAEYKATFVPVLRSYTVSFKNEDGSLLKAYSVKYGSVPAYDGATPAKAPKDETTQYAFDGWDKELAAVTGDAEYTATFKEEPRTYKITFNNYDGTVVKELEFAYGTTPSCDVIPTKAADNQYVYTFKDWGEIATVTGDATYTAQYTSAPARHFITFVNDNGDVLQKKEVEYGTVPAYSGETPTKERTAQYTYTFKSWDKELAEVTEPATYTATYDAEVNSYTVKFLNYDGFFLAEYTVNYGITKGYDGETPEKPADAQYNYVYAGWDKDLAAVTGDAVYTAVYNKVLKSYTIKFQNEDGEELYTHNFEYGTKPVYSGDTPEKAATAQYSYIFAGWTPEIDDVKGEAVYTAVYTEAVNKYHVIFKNTDGTVLQDTEEEYGSTPAYKGKTPQCAAADYIYTFDGWNEELAPITGETVITAKYKTKANSFNVKFENYDGSELYSANYRLGETPVYGGTEPVKENDSKNHYTFKGWNRTVTKVTGNAVYKAEFTEQAHDFELIEEAAPTCTESGKKTFKCTVCGYTFDEEQPSTGHSYGEVITEGDSSYKECSVCHDRVEVNTDKDKEQNLCKYCGKYHYKYIWPDFGRLSCLISRFLTFLAELFKR